MGKNYSNYLQFLASDYNILYIGRDSQEVYDETASYFLSASSVAINEEILDKMNTILSKENIKVVVIDVQDNNELAVDFYRQIKAYNEEILIMLMFNPKEYKKLFEIVPLVDTTVSYPIDKDIFHKKLFTLLSRNYAINSIGRREIVLKQKNVLQEESIDKFFDTYEGSSLFIADDLTQIVHELNDGNLSKDFLLSIAIELDKVADIFSKTEQTLGVSSIYEDLASYLRNLDIEAIAPQNLEAFTYLSEILSDVSVYLMDMFVDRLFKDVYVFSDSLKSNIDFMKNRLDGHTNEEDEVGELDFF